MSVHLQREIDRVKKSILALCAIVEDQVQMAVQALLNRDADMAGKVEGRDTDFDHREVRVAPPPWAWPALAHVRTWRPG